MADQKYSVELTNDVSIEKKFGLPANGESSVMSAIKNKMSSGVAQEMTEVKSPERRVRTDKLRQIMVLKKVIPDILSRV